MRLLQPQLALEQRGAAAGIHHPARLQHRLGAVVSVANPVQTVATGFAQINPADLASGTEVDAQCAGVLAEEILETAAVQLPRRRRQRVAHAHFGARVDVLARVAEEKAETELADLPAVQMLA